MRILFSVFFICCLNILFAQTNVKEEELIRAGMEQIHRGNLSRAISLFDKILKINPKNIQALYNKGFALENLNHFKEAITIYSQVLKIKQDDKYYLRRGYCYFQTNQYQNALQDYNILVKKYPNSSDLLLKRAKVFIKLQQWNLVLQDFNTYLQKNPTDYAVRVGRSLLLAKLGKKSEAYKEAERLFKEYPQSPIVINNWARTLLRQNNIHNALQYINKAIDINPSYAAAYITRAQIHAQLKNRDAAIKDYTKAQKLGFNLDLLEPHTLKELKNYCENEPL